MPGFGWIDFDPTRASVGTIGLVTVAFVRDPRYTIPLHGTYIGLASDFLAMEVLVRVNFARAAALDVIPQRPTRRQSGRSV